MRVLLLFSFVLFVLSAADHAGAAQQRRGAPPPPSSGIALTLTGPNGATLPGVLVEVTGPSEREGKTDASGQISFPGLPAGTYRVRFSGEAVVASEREITLRAGQVTRLTIALNSASPAPEPEPPPLPAAEAPSPVGLAGEPQVLSLVDLIERELVASGEPRKDTLVACSGSTRSMLVQLNEPQARRVYESAEALYYVIAGEGAIMVEGRERLLQAGGYAALPRGTAHALQRTGRRPLILLAVLSGEPCEVAR